MLEPNWWEEFQRRLHLQVDISHKSWTVISLLAHWNRIAETPERRCLIMVKECLVLSCINTFVKCEWTLLQVDLSETVYDPLVLWSEQWLVDESYFHNFKWLHDKNLNPSRDTTGEEILERIKHLAHYSTDSWLISL